jgi:hypothetical protein
VNKKETGNKAIEKESDSYSEKRISGEDISYVTDCSSKQMQGVHVVRQPGECSSSHSHPTPELHPESLPKAHSPPFLIYILCEQMRQGMGNCLINTGSQISLVTERSLLRGAKIEKQSVQVNGITGNTMETKGQTNLTIGETSPH